MAEKLKTETIMKGIGASPGICIGKAYLVDKRGVEVVGRYGIAPENLEKETNRFKKAVEKAKDELKGIIDNTSEDLKEHADIMASHIVLLKDKMLYGRTIETIEKEMVNAEWALKKVMNRITLMFEEIEDPYLKERASDIVNVSDRIMRHLVGAPELNISQIDKRVILVASDLSPADTSQINLERIMGFVTDLGGKASHTAIIARTLEIPAILGLKDATRKIKNDDIIILDGSSGIVILNPDDSTLIEYGEKQAGYEAYTKQIIRSSKAPAITTDGLKVPVMGNIELPEEVVSVLDHGGEGIGLYRTEFQYLNRPGFPSEEELFEKYKDVVDVLGGRPVTIRTIDINGDKAVNPNITPEANPALGLRAIRYCLKNKEIFRIQLKAVLRAAAFGPVRLLLPMISSVEEVVETKKVISEAAADLKKEGKKHMPDPELGVMLEVPSSVIMADVIARHVDFFSIGTNDLIQYLLAIDRGNSQVAHLYQPLNPAVLRLLKHVSTVAQKSKTRLFMCGEMAAEPLYAPLLIGLGIDELSMSPLFIPSVKNIIRAIDAKEASSFMDEVLEKTRLNEITDLILSRYGDLVNGYF